jgi:streptogramin lyase
MRRTKTLRAVVIAAISIALVGAGLLLVRDRHAPPPAARSTPSPSATPSVKATFDGVEIACAKPNSPPWMGAELCLPQGQRAAVYDAKRDVIWVSTWAQGPLDEHHDLNEVQLTEFHPASGASLTRTIEKLPADKGVGVGIPIAVAADGRVWFAWRHMLARFDPTSTKLKMWSLPQASFDPNPNASGTDGYPNSVTAHGDDVWVTVEESRRLWRFDARTGRWDSVSLGPLSTVGRSDVGVLSDGSVAVNGVVRRAKNVFVGRLAIVDRKRRAARLQDPVVNRFVIRGDGSLVVADDNGVLRVFDPATGRLGTAKIGAGRFNFNEKLVSDHLGRLWLTSHIDRKIVIARVDIGALARSEYPYPVASGTIMGHFGSGPHEVIFDPSIQAVIVDVRGDAWVFSADGPSAGYPSVYRLRPE